MNKLTQAERRVIVDKGTEAPFTGQYTDTFDAGTYRCKQCDAPLYRSADKFESSCGWASFDDEIEGAVKQIPDADGRRTEIVCARCGGHLGHVFVGEKYTPKDQRHCVNSLSLDFTPAPATDTAIFAGGCFWGVEHLMQQQAGVLSAESGYIGGSVVDPSYKEVCGKKTGHAEAVRVLFNPAQVSYKRLAQLFFEIHDPTQSDGQGPDLGPQYRSEVFYNSDAQKETTEGLISELKARGFAVVTRVTPATKFYPAEEYHQDYYQQKGTEPYCHARVERF